MQLLLPCLFLLYYLKDIYYEVPLNPKHLFYLLKRKYTEFVFFLLYHKLLNHYDNKLPHLYYLTYMYSTYFSVYLPHFLFLSLNKHYRLIKHDLVYPLHHRLYFLKLLYTLSILYYYSFLRYKHLHIQYLLQECLLHDYFQ